MRVHGATDDDWTAGHTPAADTLATATKAAVSRRRNVCTGITVTLAAGASAPTAIPLAVYLVDGATGGTTYLWQGRIAIAAVAGACERIVVTPCWFVGTVGTAMTLEFSVKGGSNTLESVSMSGTLL
jgi:hypothetical protein